MSDETVMQRVDRDLADTGLHAVTPGSVERLVAEVERLRADALESIAREGVLRAEVERLRGHVDDLMLGDNATIERLRDERDEARAEVERFEHERNEAWGRMDGLERERDEARAEVERLRAVAEAAERLRQRESMQGAEWWVVFERFEGDAICAGCRAPWGWHRHFDACPASALDRALDALGGE